MCKFIVDLKQVDHAEKPLIDFDEINKFDIDGHSII